MMLEVHLDNANSTKCLDTFPLLVRIFLESYKLPYLRQLPLKILLGLLRLQTQLGDYHQALKAIENVSLDMKTSGSLTQKYESYNLTQFY